MLYKNCSTNSLISCLVKAQYAKTEEFYVTCYFSTFLIGRTRELQELENCFFVEKFMLYKKVVTIFLLSCPVTLIEYESTFNIVLVITQNITCNYNIIILSLLKSALIRVNTSSTSITKSSIKISL